MEKDNKLKKHIAELTEANILDQFAKGKRLKDSRTNNCVIYTRVSGKEQEEGYSLDTQLKECKELAEKNGYNILGYFGGTYESAQTDERKEFSRMLQFAKRSKEKITYIIVFMLDRFSRSGANAIYIKEQLKQTGIYITSVRQPVDASTSSGEFQQNIQMIFSHYDNQLRKERCRAGVKAALQNGVWCAHTPTGYTKIIENGQTKIIVNETGKLLRKAFHWKANEQLSNEECRVRLEKLGVKLSHQRLSVIFKNPFYCGLMAHNALEGKLMEGKHEKLISQELFLKVNEVQNKNSHGYKQVPEHDNIPLKLFFKCDCCKTGFTGYIVKKKNIWYYKCRNKGCGNNKSAKELNKVFDGILSSFTVNDKYRPLLKELMIEKMKEENKELQSDTALLKSQIQEIDKKLERLEERYMEEEFTQELYVKYATKYKEEKLEVVKELSKFQQESSNLENDADYSLEIAQNLSELWHSGEYKEKHRLQYYLFPQGLRYNKKNDTVRTDDYNWLFLWMTRQQQDASNKKSGIPLLGLSYAALVAGEGFEPPTFGL